MKIAIIGSMHGSEPLGAVVISLLRSRRVPALYVIGNPAALQQNTRYLDSDLNRSFPGSENGNREERRAHELLQELRDIEFIIDIHTTTADTEPFIIAVQETTVVRRLIDAVPLQKVVFMPCHFANGRSLIDHVPGVSIECNETTSPQVIATIIEDTLRNYSCRVHSRKEEYVGIEVLHGSAKLKNFSLIRKGMVVDGVIMTRDFYPVLSGEQAYAGISCIMAILRINYRMSLNTAFQEQGL